MTSTPPAYPRGIIHTHRHDGAGAVHLGHFEVVEVTHAPVEANGRGEWIVWYAVEGGVDNVRLSA